MTLISEIGNFSYIQLKQYNQNKDIDWHSIIDCIKNNAVIDFSIYIQVLMWLLKSSWLWWQSNW
jgi:hypothetical protein